MTGLQLAEDGVARTTGTVPRLGTESVRGHQFPFEPVADLMLAHPSGTRGRLHLRDVEVGQSLVHAPGGGDVICSDRRRVRGEVGPKAVADDLELHRLHRRSQVESRFGAALDLDAAQIIDQVLGRLLGEVHTERRRRPSDGLLRRGRIQKLDPVPRDELVGEEREVGVELGNEILPHREQCPATSVSQRFADLAKERLLLVPVGWIQGEHFLELVEDEAGIAIGVGVVEPAEILIQTDRGEFGGVELFFGGPRLLERGEDAEAIAIGPCTFARRRRVVANSNGREHLELELFEFGAEAGFHERRLAGSRLRVEQHDTVRHHAGAQLPYLAVAAVDAVVSPQ